MSECDTSKAKLFRDSEITYLNFIERKHSSIGPTMSSRGSLWMANEFAEMLFKPILQNEYFEAFHNHAETTLESLHKGLLLNAREVEASLIAKIHVRFYHPEGRFGENHLASS